MSKNENKDGKISDSEEALISGESVEIIEHSLMDEGNHEKLLPIIREEGGDGSFLPAKVPDTSAPIDQFTLYMREISRYDLLSPEQEASLTKILDETGDIEVAKQLVQANLRLVVKIAMEYRRAYSNLMDLIQEGNIGLMKAVSKYDPTKGAKLSYYASWWIRSYILKFLLDNFKLVKVGTTAEQKKLFYHLLKEKDRLLGMGIKPETKLISHKLGVSEKSVEIMEQRLDSSDLSLDKSYQDQEGGQTTLLDSMVSDEETPEEKIDKMTQLNLLKDNLGNFMETLNERDQIIFEKRLLSEVPPSLQSIADDYGVSRERIRQIEERVLNKLKSYMAEFIR